jgi:magnesium transporter
MTNLETPTLTDLIAGRRWQEIREIVAQQPIAETADLLLELDRPDRVLLFRALPRSLSSTLFAELEAFQQNELLNDLTDEETRHLLAGLRPDDRTQLFEELPGQVTQKLLNLLNRDDLREARQLLGYPEESVGRLMTPDYVAVRPHWTITEALQQIRKMGRDSETVHNIYVVDNNWRLLDALDLRRFILADTSLQVQDIMDDAFVSLSAFADREEAIQAMQRYDLSVLPVVDSDGILVGIVTFDDVLDVIEAETTEDFHKTAAVGPVLGNYRDATFSLLYRKRIPWLVVLVITNLASGAVIASYEATLEAAIALVFFLPLLIDSSGNAGSQSATLIVRALAMGDVQLRDWASLMAKEISVSLALGLTMSLAVWGIAYWRGGTTVGLTVAMTMFLVVMVGSIIGHSLPFILSRLNWDPATASAPLITSLADITGVLIYFYIATRLLGLAG